MFKAKLAEMSPDGSNEALMWLKITPEFNAAGEVVLVGKEGRSVDVQGIQERFKVLGISGIQWQRLVDLSKVRNNIEHYYSDQPRERLREVMAGSFHLIQQFCLPHLGIQPVDFLGEEYWEFLVEEDAFFTKELEDCRTNLYEIDWPLTTLEIAVEDMRCLRCESPLVKAEDPTTELHGLRFVCTKCGERSGYEIFVEAALQRHFEGAQYVAMTDGGDSPLDTCYLCGMETWVLEEAQCAACTAELQYTECGRCRADLSLDEQHFHGLCGYCNNLFEKDD